MSFLAGVHAVVPEHRYAQAELTDEFTTVCLGPDGDRALVARLHANSRIDTRHMAIPLSQYKTISGFGEANDLFITHAVDLGSAAVLGALDRAGLRAEDVDLIVFTTVTGMAVPSIDARIAARIGLREDVRRLPIFGLGCVAGAAGIARVHDYLIGHPTQVGVLVSVELCSLTVQRGDRSVANLVASGLFGDGASAVVMTGAEHPIASGPHRPRIVGSRSRLYPDSERTMGWDIGAQGLKIVLNAQVPDLVHRYLGDDVRDFLAEHDLKPADVAEWVSHPGGPKVIEAIEDELDLHDGQLDRTWRSLARIGNLSSSSVLHVLRDTLDEATPPPGSPGVVMAMGPGFCSEIVLVHW